MGFADVYFKRQKDFKVKIRSKPNSDLRYTVVIPCYYEFKLIKTLLSLWDSNRTDLAGEVIIVINSAEDSDQKVKEQNKKTYNEVKNWIAMHDDSLLRFFVLYEQDLPGKNAGAGLARKIGMDQALHRFNQINQDKGVIISLDADAIIKEDYFTEIEKHFKRHPKTTVATIYFEHPVTGNEFSTATYQAITIYELYLRYYKQALNFSGFPYARYTVGSCFVVNAEAYAKQGGMNRKQAGEDFYFLHKVLPLGNSYEINTTCVYPSARPSNRVPFGTGPMVKSISEKINEQFLTYNFHAFVELKSFFGEVTNLFRASKENIQLLIKNLPDSVSEFLAQNDFQHAVAEINQNSSSLETFTKRFYNWFDAFKVLKYLNFSHKKFFVKKELNIESRDLYNALTKDKIKDSGYSDLLELYRQWEREF